MPKRYLARCTKTIYHARAKFPLAGKPAKVLNGFNDDQILELRSGAASFDDKLDALAKFVKDTTIQRGKPAQANVEAFLNAGYTKANLVDTLIVIGDKIISNFLHGVGQFPVDFPAAVELETANA